MNSISIPLPVLDRAFSLAGAQALFPVSPAARDAEGAVCLCAAAVMARAGLHVLQSPHAAQTFAANLEHSRDKQLMFDVFHQFGWPEDLCAHMIKRNDDTPPEQRASVFRETVESLRYALVN